MASEKSARAAKIVQLLPKIEYNRRMLMEELASLYPRYEFTWDDSRGGLCIHMPIGSIRLSQAVLHAAAVVTQSINATESVYLKNRSGVTGPIPDAPKPPRTWHERLGADFG